MRSDLFSKLKHSGLVLSLILASGAAQAESSHGIAMYGDPALPQDFVSLPYANADAPKGGTIALGEGGSFDSLNPFILKGSVPWQLRFLGYESLMGRSWDEPFTLYGLIAESIETGPNREWVEFTLRPEAAFSDGSPITVEDVIWSYETLGTQGHPRYRGLWKKIDKIEATGERSVRITFNTPDRELVLLAGMRPILKKSQWDGVDFEDSGLDLIPIGSSPYVIDDYEAGRFLSLKRNPDYWGKDVPYMQGLANLDEIRLEFFADSSVIIEAFKGGILNSQREFNVATWDAQYDFPAVQNGDVVKSILPHQRPSGMTGLVMNSRTTAFSDWRVRDAMLNVFNFEAINDSKTGGQQPRISSYFSNSVLAMEEGPATGKVAEFLAPYTGELLPGALDGYSLPVSDGTARNRKNIRRALAQFESAGWTVQDGMMKNAAGAPFSFEVLLKQGAKENQSIMDSYVSMLERVGITPTVTVVDTAQYKERSNAYDFDMAYYRRGLSLSPGNEQYLYWGSEGVIKPGSRNMMGMDSPAAEAMIDKLVNSTDQSDFVAATRALDRILTTGRYVIPFYQWNISRIAHVKELKYPERLPMYGDWIGFQPDTWWWEE
ncbi:extracellular solute-binding protein [Candidatus Halocynthiibacter alkanivorans]|uniref:extracellular solute-binding protein n=1 Tax=Candidatus Halocynthiibacter alkanivorans TaxID=2267619 RepID=UPI000DF1357D|nr:extracellular solute-binding protein [Candidatus Halocynthiibacter alkanivorans]